MKNKLITILVFVCCLSDGLLAEEAKIGLFKENELAGTFIWELSSNQFNQLPKWAPNKEEPPVSVGRAIAAAMVWMKNSKNNPYHAIGSVDRISLRPMKNPNDGGNYYYMVTFDVGPYGNHMTCVVLMDGGVLEPKIVPLEN